MGKESTEAKSAFDKNKQAQTRTYERSESVVFRKTKEGFGGLSNMASGFPLKVNGIRIRTSEALYQACRFPHLPDVQRSIIGQVSPMTAKMKGKPYRKDSRPDWERVRVKVMRWCLRVKLAQNWDEFSKLLISTGDRAIVEESRKDDFWGAKLLDENTLVGMNVLGRLLMELREEIKNCESEQLMRVEPLQIPNFLLYGKLISIVEARQWEPSAAARPSLTGEQGLTSDRRKPDLISAVPRVEQPALFDNANQVGGNPTKGGRMIHDLKPYPAMKDSGVPWLGEVPEHWEVLPNRALFAEVKERDHSDEQMLSVTITKGVIHQRALLAGSSKKDSSNLDKSAYKLVCPGDIAYNKMRAWQGAIGVSDLRGIISPAYVVQRLRKAHCARYFHFLFRTPQFAKEAERWSYGITSDMWSLRPEHFRMIYSSLPSQDEQSAIVRFLDHADRRIRRFIRAKQNLIKLLVEQKQAIIHQAVTRGLDPNVRLKPSGVEWLGDVPEHWEVFSLGVSAESIQTGPFGSQLHANEYVNGGTPAVNPSHMHEGRIIPDPAITVNETKARELMRHSLQVGDIVAARRGELGRCALVGQHEAGWLCGTGSLRIRPKSAIFVSAYMLLVFSSQGVRDTLSLSSIGATMDNLNAGMVARLRLPCPPLDEQRQIISYVASESSKTKAAVDSAHREIDLLREYRTRLVADIVTGKLDVREAAASLPDEPDEPATLDETEILLEGDEEATDSDLEAVPEEAEA